VARFAPFCALFACGKGEGKYALFWRLVALKLSFCQGRADLLLFGDLQKSHKWKTLVEKAKKVEENRR
jgi:hypothetical protein